MYSPQLIEALGSLDAPVDPPSTSFPPLYPTNLLQKWSPNDQNTPLGIPNISNSCLSYFSSYLRLLQLESLESDKPLKSS